MTPIAPGYLPVTDGNLIAFQRGDGGISLYNGSTIIEITPSSSMVSAYAVNSGWLAFTKDDIAGTSQVWTRSPAGDMRQVSLFGTSSTIDAIGSDGSVIFLNGNSRYYSGPSGSPVRINSAWGDAIWRDGRFVLLLENGVFSIAP